MNPAAAMTTAFLIGLATCWTEGAYAQAPTGDGGAGRPACMAAQLPGRKAAVRSGMQTWRASNRDASPEQRKAERRSLAQQWRETHRDEVRAARAVCDRS